MFDIKRLEVVKYEEGGVGMFLTLATFGAAKVFEKAIDAMDGDDNHGWWCYLKDIITGVEHAEWGSNKIEAYQKTMKAIIPKVEEFEENYKREQEEKKREQERIERIERQKQIELQKQQSVAQVETDPDKAMYEFLFKAIAVIAIVFAAIWLLFNVVVPIIVINASLLLLIASLIFKKHRKYLLIASVLGVLYIILDINFGWYTKSLPLSVKFFSNTIPYFYYLNIFAGLLGAGFLAKTLSDELNNNEGVFNNQVSIFKSVTKNTDIENSNIAPQEVNSTKILFSSMIVLLFFSLSLFIYFTFFNHNVITNTSNVTNEIPQASETTQVANSDYSTTNNVVTTTNDNTQTNATNQENTIEFYKEKINSYYTMESQRNFDLLYNTYLKNLTQYYDLYNPTYSDLQTRFEHAWSVTSDVTNTIKNYDLSIMENFTQIKILLDYKYFGIKSQEYKTVNDIKLFFLFDEDGNIVTINNEK
jgi:hypothetical protein